MFRVEQVLAKDVGPFDGVNRIDLTDFGEASIVFAANGSGKTTLLEMMSVLGHLPCLPLWTAGTGLTPSLLRRVTVSESDFSSESWIGPCERLLDGQAVGDGLEWLQKTPFKEHGTGAFILEVKDDERRVRFAIIAVRRSKEPDSGNATLTAALSRDPGEPPWLNDADDTLYGESDYALERALLCVPLSGQKDFDDLNEFILRGRSFYVDGLHRGVSDSPSWEDHLQTQQGTRRVTYLNSDLNDFGRGNDLRESPKLLTRSFGSQLVDRLGIEFQTDGQYEHMASIKEIFNQTFEAGVARPSSDVWAASTGVTLSRIVRWPGECRARIWTTPLGQSEAQENDTLSSGENEVLFLTMAVLSCVRGTPGGSSIVLLDEPDLHLDPWARSRFLELILRQCDSLGQTVIASHSVAAIRATERVYGRRSVEHLAFLYKRIAPSSRRDAARSARKEANIAYDPRSIASVSSRGLRNYIGQLFYEVRISLEAAISPPLGSPALRSLIRKEATFLTQVLLILVPITYLISGVNDILDFFDLESYHSVREVHQNVAKASLVYGVFAFSFCVQALAVKFERRFARSRGLAFGDRSFLSRVSPAFLLAFVTALVSAPVAALVWGS